MDANTAMVLAIGVPATVLSVAAAIDAKYKAEREKLNRGRNRIHPIAQIYRQMNGLDLNDESEADLESLQAEVKELRQQIAALRDTTTQYDLSIDHQLHDLDVRVAGIERSRDYAVPAKTSEESQSIRLNSGG